MSISGSRQTKLGLMPIRRGCTCSRQFDRVRWRAFQHLGALLPPVRFERGRTQGGNDCRDPSPLVANPLNERLRISLLPPNLVIDPEDLFLLIQFWHAGVMQRDQLPLVVKAG